METQEINNLTAKIAALIHQSKSETDEFLRSNLEKIDRRLDKIESRLEVQSPKSKAQSPMPFHVSQEKFINLEELADEIIDGLQNEKACPYEPAGKPCDNCSMCNSRGF